MQSTEDQIETLDAALSRLEAQLEAAGAEADALDGSVGGMAAGVAAAQKSIAGLDRSLSGGLKSAMRGVIFEGDKLSSVFQNLAQSMVVKTFNQSIDPVTDAISGAVTGGIGSLVGAILPFAKGGVISQGQTRAFATGGVVDGPTQFPMKNGTGLMGEAGPEAIMPLARGPDGRLGVRGGGATPVNITMNVTTPDAAGFKKSKSQIAAGLSRALQAGQRNF